MDYPTVIDPFVFWVQSEIEFEVLKVASVFWVFSFLPHVIHPHQIPAVISLGLSMLRLLCQSRTAEMVRVTEWMPA